MVVHFVMITNINYSRSDATLRYFCNHSDPQKFLWFLKYIKTKTPINNQNSCRAKVKCTRYEVFIAMKGVMPQHQLVGGNRCFREIYFSTTNYTSKMETAHSLAQPLHNLKTGTVHSSETLVTTYRSTCCSNSKCYC